MIRDWFDRTIGDLARQMRWSFLPPLMVYFAAGVSGLTSVVGVFFVKDYLGLSAAFLAGLTFWAGLPWVLKMPVGHLVDLIWRRKALLVLAGALLIGGALLIMYALIAHTEAMRAIMPVEAWYVFAALLSPAGYVIQDVVADAMTVEAVPQTDAKGELIPEAEAKSMHTTMQTLGRIAIIGGLAIVAGLNIYMFAEVGALSADEKAQLYSGVYLIALTIPLVSLSGVALNEVMLRVRARRMRSAGVDDTRVREILFSPPEKTEPDWRILAGSLTFVVLSITVGLSDLAWSQEIVFAGSMTIVIFLISRLMRALDREKALALMGTAAIIFVFRAAPLPGPGLGWFEIDILGFDEQFLAILAFVTSGLTLVGLVVLRPLMARRSIAYIVVLLTLAGAVLALPNIGLAYGLHEWTAARTGGVIDARFIAILDTAIESPLGQIAMIPMLAWIARNAPAHLKATFFAVMASFTNLALSASSLATKWLNELFVISREVRVLGTGQISMAANYEQLGPLLITVALASLAAPIVAVLAVQASRFRTSD